MENKTITTGVLMDENTTISFVEVCEKFDISEELLQELIEYGLYEPSEIHVKKVLFDVKKINRIQSACRLQKDLGINTPGVVLVLELLDQIEQIKNELQILQRHVDRDRS